MARTCRMFLEHLTPADHFAHFHADSPAIVSYDENGPCFSRLLTEDVGVVDIDNDEGSSHPSVCTL